MQEHNEVHRGISIAYALYKYCNFILPVRHELLSSLDLLTAPPIALHSYFHALYTPHQLCKLLLAFDWQNCGIARPTQKQRWFNVGRGLQRASLGFDTRDSRQL